MEQKNISDRRAISDIGAAIFVKRGGESKYHLWLTVTNIPATGSTNESIDTTVTTSIRNTSVDGRQNPGTKEFTYFAHRDNFEILREDNGKELDFLQVNPDMTGHKFSGKVRSYQDEVTVGSALTGKATVTVTSSEETAVINVLDLIQDTVTFESAIDAVVHIKSGAEVKVNVETNPADATVTATLDAEGIATANIAEKVLTISGTAKGSTVVKLTAKAADCADGRTHILVVVE